MSDFDPRELRAAFGAFMTGVTVVTAVSADGAPVGFTANSYTSVSLDPPLLLVCPSRSLSSFEVFSACEHFAVNILADNQQDIANTFASPGADRFAQTLWHSDAWGCPVIDGAAVSFSCAAHRRMEAGDHLILVGGINEFRKTGAAGLGYLDGGYFSLGLERRAAELPAASHALTAGAIVEHDGRVLMVRTPQGMHPPQAAADSRTGALATLRAFLSDAGLEAVFGSVYSIFENKTTGEYSTYYRAAATDGDPRGLGSYLPVDEISSSRFASPALTDMMRRYELERRTGRFGVYVGDDVKGDVHPL